MELSIDDKKTKELLTEVMVELMQTKREVLYEIVLEALEDVGLGNALIEGRKNDYVPESEILSILDGKAQ
jgi:hypothetical protein